MMTSSSSLDFLLASPAIGPNDTFDLGYYLAVHADYYPSLLEVSPSIQSLPSVSSADNIPPFPADRLLHKVPVETFLSLHEPNYLGCLSTSPFVDPNRDVGNGVLLAAPTVPRLRDMLKEPLHIGKWLSGLVPNATFSIWKVERTRILAWKAEEALRHYVEAFKKRHSLRVQKDDKQRRRAKLNRNALIFEREVMSGNERSAKISVKVPTTLIGTETNEDILSLDQLNALFKMEAGAESESVSHVNASCAGPPRLMVSTSDAIFPVSLESSRDLPNTPQTLAARRGKKMLPYLSLNQSLHEELYPSIPTAFLGASSNSLSPSHPVHHSIDNAEMDLRSMVLTLQSRRVSTPFLPVHVTDGVSRWQEDKANMVQETDSHKWTLVDASVAEYGDFSFGSCSNPATASFVVSSTGIGETDSPNTTGDGTSMSLLAQLDSASPELVGRKPIASSPPQTIKTSPQETRGILMGCRSVRFTDPPSTLDKYIPYANTTRNYGTQAVASKVARRPFTISSGISIGRPRPPNPFKPADKTAQTTHAADVNIRPASTPSCGSRNGRMRGNMTAPQHHSTAQPPKSGVAPPSRLRAITNASAAASKSDKGLNIPLNTDENVGRRDSSISRTSKGAPAKKKIQKPLRNLFTRLK